MMVNNNKRSVNKCHNWLCLALLACAGAIACPCFSQVFNQQQFVPDYLHADSYMQQDALAGKGDGRHFSAYGLDNDDLDQAAANFNDNRLNTTQRLLNHQWLNQQYHDDHGKKGTKIFSKLLKAGAKAYWNQIKQSNFANNAAVPDSSGQGQVDEVNYRMRLNGDSLKLSVSYEF